MYHLICDAQLLLDTFPLVASGGSLHQLPLPGVLMVQRFVITLSVFDVMRNKDYYYFSETKVIIEDLVVAKQFVQIFGEFL